MPQPTIFLGHILASQLYLWTREMVKMVCLCYYCASGCVQLWSESTKHKWLTKIYHLKYKLNGKVYWGYTSVYVFPSCMPIKYARVTIFTNCHFNNFIFLKFQSNHFLFFFDGSEIWPQGFMLARQTLYCLNHASNPWFIL
jgi:hypothetical protein